MAALMEGIAFSPISNELDLLAVTDKNSKSEVIVTNRRKTFEIYKLSDRKPLKSWSVRHGVTLTSPVIGWSDTEKDRFLTVTNNHDVRLWDGDTVDFEKAKRKHSASKIHQVFVAPGLSPIILYECGATGFLSHIKDAPGNGCIHEGEKIHWCCTQETERKLHVLFVAETKNGLKLCVSTYDQDSDSWQQHTSDIKSPEDNKATLCSCDGYKTTDNVSIFLLWSNNVLMKVCVEDGEVIDTCNTQTVSGTTTDSSLVMLDSTHAAITGIIQNNQAGICIFNVKFGIQQAWQAFLEKPRSKHKVFCVENYIFIPCGRMLYAYKFECQASSVASLLGQGSNTQTTSRENVSGNFNWTAHGKRHCKASKSSKSVIELFETASNKSLTYEKFKSAFQNLIKQLNDPSMKHWLVGTQMVQLLRQLLSQTKFWPQHELAKLISMGCIPHSMTDALLDSLIQHTEVALVHQMMDTIPNITERALCKALTFYLSCEESKLQSSVDNDVSMREDEDELEEDNCPLSTHRALLINKILQMPFSDVFLLESLRHTTFKHALTLVEYLSYLLKTHTNEAKTSDNQMKLGVPQMLQVLDWLSLLLDAHMTQFVLSPDSHVTLVNLRTFVATQVEFQSILDSFESLLEQIMAKTTCTQKARVGRYCIEALHIL